MPRKNNNPDSRAPGGRRRDSAPSAGGRDSQRRSSGRSRRGRERRLSVRSELRQQPDVGKIARAVIAMAMAQAEAEAAAQAETTSPETGPGEITAAPPEIPDAN